MKENVEKFFALYNSDPVLKKRIKDAEAAYPGSLELREPLVETVPEMVVSSVWVS